MTLFYSYPTIVAFVRPILFAFKSQYIILHSLIIDRVKH